MGLLAVSDQFLKAISQGTLRQREYMHSEKQHGVSKGVKAREAKSTDFCNGNTFGNP